MRCFVIMPFGNKRVDAERARKFDSIYSQWIKPTVESIQIPSLPNERIECHRADKIARPGEIISHVIESLVESDIVIADLSERNPNVFYELGVRHAMNNNTILIADDLDDIPFDLRALRTVVYRYEPESMLALKSSIEKAISEIVQEPDRIDNPVRRFLYNRDVDKLAEQSSTSESDVIRSLLAEMSCLRKEFSDQTNEVRQVMKLVTSTKGEEISDWNKQEVDQKFFEGIWKDELSQTVFYARVINGELFVPYCYGGASPILTGRFYNCRLIAKTLFTRFEWFGSDISGYAFLKVESNNRLVGGWWYRDDLPREVISGVSKVNESIPRMVAHVLARQTGSEQIASCAEEYFERLTNQC